MELAKSGAEIIAEFKKRRTRQIMAVGSIILAFIALRSVEGNQAGIFGLPPNTVLGIAFALIISVLIFSLSIGLVTILTEHKICNSKFRKPNTENTPHSSKAKVYVFLNFNMSALIL